MSDPFEAHSLKRPLPMQIPTVVTEETETRRRQRVAVVVRIGNKSPLQQGSGNLVLFCSTKAVVV